MVLIAGSISNSWLNAKKLYLARSFTTSFSCKKRAVGPSFGVSMHIMKQIGLASPPR